MNLSEDKTEGTSVCYSSLVAFLSENLCPDAIDQILHKQEEIQRLLS